MLAIRMQRTGRRGHAMFRVIVQDARRTPTSGKVVARVGSYDPHAKTVVLDKEKAAFYLEHGAQPSDRVVRLLKDEGIKLPAWVTPAAKQEGTVRNPAKRRSTRPPEPEAPAEEAPVEPAAKATEPAEAVEEKPAEEPAAQESEPADSEAEVAEPEVAKDSAESTDDKPQA